jgi:hypothetical protein
MWLLAGGVFDFSVVKNASTFLEPVFGFNDDGHSIRIERLYRNRSFVIIAPAEFPHVKQGAGRIAPGKQRVQVSPGGSLQIVGAQTVKRFGNGAEKNAGRA